MAGLSVGVHLACERLGKTCYGSDLEPVYVDISVKRWEEITGMKATLIGKTT